MVVGEVVRDRVIEVEGGERSDGRSAPMTGMTADDLAELIRSFEMVTEQLQRTHGILQSEVLRLQAELREANQQLKRSEDLAALGQMAAGIAHEIRNPLGSIRLYASMLGNDLADHPESQSMAMKIEQSTIELDEIVGDVLAFSRNAEPSFGAVCVEDLLRNTVESCAGLIHSHDIEILWSIEGEGGDGLPMVKADGRLMGRAIGNVLRNAVEASERGGRIEIGAGLSHVVASGKGVDGDSVDGVKLTEGVAITIRDYGVGVDEDAMAERVFQPFFTTKATGTGLGLAIAHRIVDGHGGMISIGNHASGGAVVRMVLRRWEDEWDGGISTKK